MSNDPLASFRNSTNKELLLLAHEHIKHDLTETDRDNLTIAATQFRNHARIGSLIGLALGSFLAFRSRQRKIGIFRILQSTKQPTSMNFADGHVAPIPDLTPYLRPSVAGAVLSYFFGGGAGFLIGGQTGILSGTWAATKTISSDVDSQKRIESGFRKLRIDVLKKKIRDLERGVDGTSSNGGGDGSSSSPFDGGVWGSERS